MYKEKTIEDVVKNSLCTGCGTCVSLCPTNAIEIARDNARGIYFPKLRHEKCNKCGFCLKVCPGFEIKPKRLSIRVDDAWQLAESKTAVTLGANTMCYFGHSTDYNIRYNAASGGLITTLLVFALENGIIDGALVTQMEKDRPLSPRPFIARTKDEIIEASTSKYCPVPANTALKEILSNDGKYAIVGLPCHINGARKSEKVNKELKKRIKLHFGLFCSHTDNFCQTEYFLNSNKIKPADVATIKYRGNGWPGHISVELKSGDCKELPFHSWAIFHRYSFFAPTRCLICSDGLAELSDISFGDAWFPEIVEKERIGESIIVSRNQKGEELLKMATKSGAIELTKVSSSVLTILRERERVRRNGIKAKLFFLRLLGKQLPNSEMPVLRSAFSDYLRSSIVFMNRYIASKKCLWGTLKPLIRVEEPIKKLTETSGNE
jgi:coenzyme F420 hydrogenase subunit beta